MFATIPSDWPRHNQFDRYEGSYASVFYARFAGIEGDVTLEECTSRVQQDAAVRAGGRIYLFEVKALERAGRGAAMAQLKARGRSDKYRHQRVPACLVGVEFSTKTRNVERFDFELA